MLKQVRRLWNKTIIKFLKIIYFDLTNADLYIFVFRKENRLVIVGVHIDNLILVANQKKVIK